MNTAMKRTRALLIAAALLSMAGCESIAPQPARDTEGASESEAALLESIAINEAAMEAQRAIAEDVLEALVPPVDGEFDVTAERFDLEVDGVSAAEFFRGLVAGTPYNMVVHPEVSGAVSLNLKDVTVDEVMRIMRDVYGYDFVQQDRLFQVFPDAIRTEIFHIDYLNIGRSGKSETRVSVGRISDAGRNATVNVGYGGETWGDSDSQGGGGGGGDGSIAGTKVQTSSDADFWKELAETLVTIIGDSEETSVVVTPQVGLVVVRAMPKALNAVRDYLDRAQLTLQRQVILEAKIIEVTLKEGFEAGIEWNTFGEGSGGSFKPVIDEDGNVIAAGSSKNVAAEFLFGDGVNFFNPLGSAFSIAAEYSDFEAILHLLESQGSVQILSSPRISTVNNQKAVIKVGGDEFFVTDVSTTTVTAGSAINTNDSPELTPFFSGIALDVTPQISEAGNVTLHIHPTVSEVQEQLKIIGGEEVPLAQSTIRESDSIVRAKSGQVVVIGGLMQTSSVDADAGVPVLGRLPLFGYAFQHKQQQSTKSELVILLKPMVVEDADQTTAIGESMDRVKALRELLDKSYGG